MPNKYCNLDGTKKIREEYPKINTGFDAVEVDINTANTKADEISNRVDTIITTPVDGTIAAQEIVDARGGEVILGARLDKYDTQLAGNEQLFSQLQANKADKTEINSLATAKANQVDLDTTNANITLKADKSYVDTQIAIIGNASPKGVYATLVALQTAFPTGTTGIYVVTADGKWYFWNGSAWTAGGVYQGTAIADKTVLTTKLEDAARFDAYPFQPLANFNNNKTAELEIKKAVKRIEIYGANPTKKYCLGIIQRNFSTYGTGAYIYECNADGTTNKIVAMTSKTAYSIPSGLDEFMLAEYQNSGISAKIWVDWNQVTDGAQYVNTHYDKAGLDAKTYMNSDVLIKLPPTMQGVVGKEFNIYFDNIILCDNLDNYDIEVTDYNSGGIQQNERYTHTPTSAKVFSIDISVYKNNKLIATGHTVVTIKDASVGSGINRSCIFVGDSTTDGGVYTGELLNLFGAGDVMDITLLGTRGTTPNLHEGRAGWKASDYVGKASVDDVVNAFWNPSTSAFDFSYYMAQQGYASVDVVGINLGINDVFGYTDDVSLNTEITNVLNRYDTILNSIKAYDANVKVAFLVTIPPSVNQDAFGKNYSSGQTQWRYKRNNFFFMKSLIDKYKYREAEGIYLVPINTNLDTEHNMMTETVVVNSRNTTTIVRQSNGVHPAASGYYQISDMIYYWLKSFES